MLDSLKENWIYVLVLVVLLIALVIIWKQALKASKRTAQRRRELMTKLDRLKALSEKYDYMPESVLSEIPDCDLIDAVMIRLWRKLGNENEEMENFKLLSLDEKDIYTAWYVREEVTNDGFFSFFRNCGHALSGLAQNVFAHIGIDELDAVMKKACDMFDENSDTSCDKESVKKLQDEFNSIYDEEKFCKATADFIRSHGASFADEEKETETGGEN